MGSWDVSPFGNDEAKDWLMELIDSNSTEPIFRALVTAAKVKYGEFLSAPECERAVAAAELVACARGKEGFEIGADVAAWLEQKKFVAGDSIAQMAIKVLERVVTDSELKQVWDDTDSVQEWRTSMRQLQQRLRETYQSKNDESLPEAPPSAEQYCEEAAVLMSEQQYDAALDKYDLAAQQNASSQVVLMGRAVCHLWMGSYEKVIDDVNKALSVGSPIADAYQMRSQAFFHLKKYRNVIADLTSYLRSRPNHVESYYIRGLAYLHLQQHQNAINDLTVVIDKNNSEHMAEALNNRAECYEVMGRPDLAAWDRQYAAQVVAAAMYRTT